MDKEHEPVLSGRVQCPYCGYLLPVWWEDTAIAEGIWVRCKGKHCKKLIEIKLEKTR